MATYTVRQTGGDFSTLAAALSDAGTVANDIISIDQAWTIADTTVATVSDDNISIAVTGDAKHTGSVTNVDHYRLEDGSTGGTAALTINNTGCEIDGLVVKVDNTGASDEAIRMAAAGGTLTVDNSILYSLNGATTGDQDGIHASAISCTVNAENTQAYGFSRAGLCSQPFTGTHTQTWNVNSCTLWDNGQDSNDGDCGGIGVKAGSSATVNVNVLNTVSMDNTTTSGGTGGTSQAGDYNEEPTGTVNWDIHNSIASDSTITARDSGAVGCLEDHNLTDDNTKASDGDWVIVEDITSSPYDLRLQDNSFNEAQDMHATASGAGLTIPATDIIGTSRPQDTNYDCGCFEIEVVGGGLTISPTGIASAEAFGTLSITTDSVTLSPTGIVSAEAFGTTDVSTGSVTLSPTGILSEEAIGTLSVTTGTVTITPSGIASAEAFGAHSITTEALILYPAGIASEETFGNLEIATSVVTISPTGIVSEEVFGTASLTTGSPTISPIGIESEETFGIVVITGGDAPEFAYTYIVSSVVEPVVQNIIQANKT